MMEIEYNGEIYMIQVAIALRQGSLRNPRIFLEQNLEQKMIFFPEVYRSNIHATPILSPKG